MHLQPVAKLFLVIAVSISTSWANPQFTNLSSQCADPTGFESCWSNATSVGQSCMKTAFSCTSSTVSCTDENNCSSSKEICNIDCVCGTYGSWINCALSHCWNLVYTCEYQNLAIQSVASCPSAGLGPLATDDVDNYIPYIPAPNNAPTGCSCDITFVLYRYGRATQHGMACAQSLPRSDTIGKKKCTCCAASEAVSTFYNTCPSTSPLELPLWNLTLAKRLAELESDECKALFSGGLDCQKLHFKKPGITGGQFYNDQNLPANGTQTISNVAGNIIASPIGGPTLVWRLGGKFDNLTAVAVSATATGSSSPTQTTSSTNGTGSSLASGITRDTILSTSVASLVMFMMFAGVLFA